MNDRQMREKIGNLRDKGIVLTLQRLAVLEMLSGSVHATAEEVYESVREKYPTISRGTVYSCLDTLKRAGEIQELTIRKEKGCFDFYPHNHHHFLCRNCGRIFNVEVTCPIAEKGEIKGHRVDEFQAYFYGVCRECRKGAKRGRRKQ